MSSSNRIVLVLLPLLALAIAFWVLALSPKRQKAAELGTKVAGLRAQVDEQEQLVVSAETARKDFPRAYRRLVVLGKAAPADDDISSLLVQLDRIAADSHVKFVSLQTQEGSGGDAAAAPAATPRTPAATAEQSEQQVANVEEGGAASATPPPATEAQASLLPIGAAIGPAGLPVMRYSLSFEGDFFRLADFVAGIDSLVRTRGDGRVGVRGRLVTIDSFDLSPGGGGAEAAAPTGGGSTDELSAEFTITTYLTPAEEGVTAGASPTGPVPVTEPTPASTAPADTGTTATASTTTP